MQLHLTATATVATTTSTSESPFSCWKWHNIITGCHSATLRATPTVTATAASHLCLYHTLLANLYGTWSWNRHNQTTITWSPQSVTVKCKNISSDIRVSLFFFSCAAFAFCVNSKMPQNAQVHTSFTLNVFSRADVEGICASDGRMTVLPSWQTVKTDCCFMAKYLRFGM